MENDKLIVLLNNVMENDESIVFLNDVMENDIPIVLLNNVLTWHYQLKFDIQNHLFTSHKNA